MRRGLLLDGLVVFVVLAVLAVPAVSRMMSARDSSGPAYPSTKQAIEGRIQMPVQIYQDVPTDGGRLVLFRGATHPSVMVVLVEQTGRNRWRMGSGFDVGPLEKAGPVGFHQKTVGEVVIKYKNGTEVRFGKTFTMYGVVNDPRLTWIEVTIPQKRDEPRKVPVVNGTWLVQWPSETGWPPYPKARLRAGDESGELFSAENVWTVG